MAGEGRDNESAEKPVREQLKKASIGGREQAALEAGKDTDMAKSHDEVPPSSDQAAPSDAPRLQKKRSFEEVEDTTQSAAGRHHTRKRSREGTTEGDEPNGNGNKRKVSGEHARSDNGTSESGSANGKVESVASERTGTPEPAGEKRSEDAVEAMTSPKTKRSRLHSTTGEEMVEDVKGAGNDATEKEAGATDSTKTRAAADSGSKIPPTSGFAHTSAVSPFGGLAGSKFPTSGSEAQTSSSTFAASGFGALSGSTTSGFGAIGKNGGSFGNGGGFGSGGKSPLGADSKKEESKSSGSAFGGALGQTSAFGGGVSSGRFGSGASGFGSGTSGFGSGLGGSGFGKVAGSGGLTSFASGKSTPLTSTAKPQSSFGAPADDDAKGEGEDEDGDEDGPSGVKSPLAVEEDTKDERFYAQDIETGEEDETTQYSARAKLYNYVTLDDGKKEWRERGLGILRLNVKSTYHSGEHQKRQARFLMRADGSHRVVLNTPIKKEITVGKPPDGGPPTNGFLYFMGTIGESPELELLQLKMRQQFALDVYEKVKDLQSDM